MIHSTAVKTSTLKRIGAFILDLLEIYIPAVAFTAMFLVFVVSVFYRYFLNSPLTWPPEIISVTFIWTTLLGAAYAQRTHEHVMFTILYDRLSPRGQLIFRLLGNSFVAIAFLFALKPTYEYVRFMSFKRSTVLKIPFSLMFAPFLVFELLIIGRMVHEIVQDLGRFSQPPAAIAFEDQENSPSHPHQAPSGKDA